jgi:hypothetical protein
MREHVLTEVDLQEDGLLWLFNTAVLHPRGLALARNPETGQTYLEGDGEEVWTFEPTLAQEKKDALEAAVARHLARVQP